MKTSRLLAKAADVLRERGHTKFALVENALDKSSGVCLFGAINLAATGDPHKWYSRNTEAPHPARDYLAAVIGCEPTHDALVGWNNYTTKDGAEVVEALEIAASMAASDGQ